MGGRGGTVGRAWEGRRRGGAFLGAGGHADCGTSASACSNRYKPALVFAAWGGGDVDRVLVRISMGSLKHEEVSETK
ncbi:hypothetical protein Kisp01_69730 [Kineosporia sp. NBRC 101677]|nr:hypothetical protein Kisp01_69730 [Kineosporia sp. NBRC 101677]